MIVPHSHSYRSSEYASGVSLRYLIDMQNMKHQLRIFQYGSQLSPARLDRYSPSDWIGISISKDSPRSCSTDMEAPKASNSSASDASTSHCFNQTEDRVEYFI